MKVGKHAFILFLALLTFLSLTINLKASETKAKDVLPPGILPPVEVADLSHHGEPKKNANNVIIRKMDSTPATIMV
jgi:hypothetical protein